MNDTSNRLMYSVAEVGEIAGICRSLVYEELNSGRLKGSKIGKRTIITKPALHEWLASLEKYTSITSEA